ncbi:MAG: hypothetical protein WC533_03335 [Candidatus Pacearchaeota archaeon]
MRYSLNQILALSIAFSPFVGLGLVEHAGRNGGLYRNYETDTVIDLKGKDSEIIRKVPYNEVLESDGFRLIPLCPESLSLRKENLIRIA